VSDTAEVIVSAAEREEMLGETYNIAGGRPISIRDLVALMLEMLHLTQTRVHYTGESWKGDITRLVADVSKIRGLGFAPKIGLEDGIRNMVAWFQSAGH